VVVQVRAAALKSFVQVLPLRFVCSVKVARLAPESVSARVVVDVEVKPAGVFVATERMGASIPNPRRGSGSSFVVVMVPSGTVTVVTELGVNCNELWRPLGRVFCRLNDPDAVIVVWYVVCTRLVVEFTANPVVDSVRVSALNPPAGSWSLLSLPSES
jgi:hypothetical protein